VDARRLDDPLHPDGRGRAAVVGDDEHTRDLIRAVLFTNPGERVNRPDFGCGLRTLVFAPSSDAIAGATELMVRAALQRWLEREIRVEEVQVRAEEATLTVLVTYIRRSDGMRQTTAFGSPGGAP
jgi:phage baseplate assembly protein W